MDFFKQSNGICLNPWNYLFLSYDGNCYFCCYTLGTDNYYIGNLIKQDIEEIWNGERAQAFRRDVLDGKYTHCNLSACHNNYIRLYDLFNSVDNKNKLIAPLPTYIQLNHDDTCTQRCVFCRDKIRGLNKEKIAFWDNLIDSKFVPLFANAKVISLLGSGEFFNSLHSQKLLKRIFEVYPDIKVELWSNGVSFTKENVEKYNLIGRFRTLHFSIHAADAATYKKIWRTNNFDKVIENLKYAAELKKQNLTEEFTLTFVINKFNYKSMGNFVLMAKELGAEVSLAAAEDRGNSVFTYKQFSYAVANPNNILYNDFVRELQNPVLHQDFVGFDFNADLKPVSKFKILTNYFIYVWEFILTALHILKLSVKQFYLFLRNIAAKAKRVLKQKNTYVSCDCIQHGFATDYENIKMCEWESHEGGGKYVIVPDYNGGEIDWKKIFKEKRKIKKLNKKGIILDSCKGCHMLKKQYWDTNEDYISCIFFNHWTTCNSKCSYCYTIHNEEDYTKKPKYSILKAIQSLADNNLLKSGGEIRFAGGEPTCLEEFEQLLTLFTDEEINNIFVDSSGVKYSPAITKAVAKGFLHLSVSVDAGSPEIFFQIKKINAFETVWENIKKYAEAQQEDKSLVKVKYIILPKINDTEDEIDKFLQLAASSGVGYVLFDINDFWFDDNKNKAPKSLYELLTFAANKAKELSLNCEFFRNAEELMNNR